MSAVAARRLRLATLLGIVALGLALRVWGLEWGLHDANVSRRTHPDEWVVYWLFQWFGANHSFNPCPSQGSECFLDWGTTFPYLAYLAKVAVSPLYTVIPHSAFGAADPAFVVAVLSGRLVSVILSAATVVVSYFLGREAYGDAVGLLTAAIVAMCGLLIQLAHFATPDSTTLFFLSLALLAMVRSSRRPSIRSFAFAGALCGAAASGEYHMLLLLAPLAAAWFLSPSRKVGTLAAAVAALAVAFLVLDVYALIDFSAFVAATEHTLRIRTVDSAVQYDGRWATYGPSWLFVTRYDLGYGVGFALTGWMLVAALWSLWKRSCVDIILLAWIAPYFVLITLSPAKFMRYGAPLLVPLAVLAARVAIAACARLRARERAILIALLAIAGIYSALYDAAYTGLFATTDPRAAAAAWVQSASEPSQTVAFEATPDGLLNLPEFFSPAHLHPCFTSGPYSALHGASYVMLDSFAPDETPPGQKAELNAFRASLATGRTYALVDQVNDVPTVLGLQFPIGGSPHDWRYPSHEVLVYRLKSPVRGSSPQCYPTLAAAASALPHRPKTG